MQLKTIEVTRIRAQAELKAYEAVIASGKATEADVEIAAGYKALAAGKRVIDINQVMGAGGLDEIGRPRLAFMRSDKKSCFFRWWDPASERRVAIFYASDADYWHSGRPKWKFQGKIFMHEGRSQGFNANIYKAPIPPIPPQYRPARTMLSRYHILWEAAWEQVPHDPVLLRHLGNKSPLYVIVAQWDLTELERSVLQNYI